MTTSSAFPHDATVNAPRRRPGLALAYLPLAAWFLLVAPALPAIVRGLMAHPEAGHAPLVAAVAMAMLWRACRLTTAASARARWLGVIWIALTLPPALLAHLYGVALHPGGWGHLFLRAITLLGCGIGALLAGLGWRRALAYGAPLLYLLFALPPPDAWAHALSASLQRGVAIGATTLLRMSGGAVLREGAILHLPEHALGVDEACGGMRSLTVLPACAVACAWALHLSVRRGMLLLFAAPAIAVIANVLRVTTLGWLALRAATPDLLDQVHTLSGYVALILGGGALLAYAHRLREDTPPSQPASGSRLSITVPRAASSPLPPLCATALLFAGIIAAATIARHYQRPQSASEALATPRFPLADLPVTIGPFQQVGERALTPNEIQQLAPSDGRCVRYRAPDGATIDAIFLYWDPYRISPGQPAPWRQAHPPEWCYEGAGWMRRLSFEPDSRPEWLGGERLMARLFTKRGRERVVIFWQSEADEPARLFAPSDWRERLRLIVRSWRAAPTAVAPARHAISIAVDVRTGPADARRVGIEFARALIPLLPDYGMATP